jgi:hypothetical protein
MFTDPALRGSFELTPARAYQYVFPAGFDLSKVAYFFEPRLICGDLAGDYEEVASAVRGWQFVWAGARRPTMTFTKAVSSLLIQDCRTEQEKRWHLEGLEAEVYEFCGDARTRADLRTRFLDDVRVDGFVESWVSADLALEMDGRILSLALPSNPYAEVSSETLEQYHQLIPCRERDYANLVPSPVHSSTLAPLNHLSSRQTADSKEDLA